MSVSRLANLSNDCLKVCSLLFSSRKLWKIALGLSEEAQCIQGAILTCASCLLPSTLSLAGKFLLLISLLIFLSTDVQSLELST